jgi:hypothetical protein
MACKGSNRHLVIICNHAIDLLAAAGQFSMTVLAAARSRFAVCSGVTLISGNFSLITFLIPSVRARVASLLGLPIRMATFPLPPRVAAESLGGRPAGWCHCAHRHTCRRSQTRNRCRREVTAGTRAVGAELNWHPSNYPSRSRKPNRIAMILLSKFSRLNPSGVTGCRVR